MKSDGRIKLRKRAAPKRRFIMRQHMKAIFLLFVALVIAITTTIAALRGHDQDNSSQDEQKTIGQIEFESQFPIAE